MSGKGHHELYVSISEESFDAIFSAYYHNLFNYTLSIVKNREVAKDIVQDVFLKLWNNRQKITITTNLRAFLLRMTHNQCIDTVRSGKYSSKGIMYDDVVKRIDLLGIEVEDGVFDKIYSDQLQAKLSAAVETLPAQCRKIFLLNRKEGLSYQEIALKLEISHSTVKNQMVIAMKKLHEALKEYL